MTTQEIPAGVRKNAELVVKLLKAGGCNFEALDLMMKAHSLFTPGGTSFEKLFDQVVSLMRTDEPPKTEETTFDTLVRGDEFLDGEGNRNLVVGGPSGSIVALPLEGMSKHILWWPGVGYPVKVKKISK